MVILNQFKGSEDLGLCYMIDLSIDDIESEQITGLHSSLAVKTITQLQQVQEQFDQHVYRCNDVC